MKPRVYPVTLTLALSHRGRGDSPPVHNPLLKEEGQ